ncbi:MAG: LLM class F420-dependent oxidoreductase [Actinomycetales bacterium]|nr:LLM class F420-dependent oxidoreductase [Actinomycetales bacterium]
MSPRAVSRSSARDSTSRSSRVSSFLPQTGPRDGIPASAADPRPARVAVQVAPQHASYAALRAVACQLDELGVDVLLTWDHFVPLSGDLGGMHFECWSILAGWAEATHRAQLGPLVSCTAYRNPNLLADIARTVDHISGGRVVLGTGSGWHEQEFADYGFDVKTAGARLDDLAAHLPVLRTRLARLNPPPIGPMPLLVGGGGERKTLRIVAEHADIWHGFGDPATLRHKHLVLDEWCRSLGRDPLAIERSAGVAFQPSRRGTQRGLPWAEHAERLYAVGTRLFQLALCEPPYDLGQVRDLLAWRDEVNRRPSQHPDAIAWPGA